MCRRNSLVLLLAFVAADVNADPRIVDSTGFKRERQYFEGLPFEHIDLLNGAVILTHDDLVLPGNAGFDLVVRRVYNSKIYYNYNLGGSRSIISCASPAGLGWSMHFGRVLQPATSGVYPIIEMPDGSQHQTYAHINGSGVFITKEYWVYNRNVSPPELSLPNGRVYRFGHSANGQLHVTQIVDQYGNSQQFTYHSSPAGEVASVTQHLGAGQSRTVTFSYAQDRLASMTYGVSTWQYSYVAAANVPGCVQLASVQPPAGPSWQYQYHWMMHELSQVTTPEGGWVAYEFGDQLFYLGSTVGVMSRAVQSRRVGGRDVALSNVVWRFDYIEHTTRVTDPTLAVSEYTFWGRSLVGDSTAPWRIGLLRRMSEGGLRAIDIEWIVSSPISHDDLMIGNLRDFDIFVPLVSSVRTTVGSQVFQKSFGYGSSNFNDFGRPSQMTETGDFARTTSYGYWYSFNPYIVDRIASITTSVGSETSTRSYGYSTGFGSIGFMTSETIRGVRTDFSPTAQGNIWTSRNARLHTTTYAYDWGLVSQVQTPEYTINKVINPDGTVASETRRSFTTRYRYDALFRLREITHPIGRPTIIDFDTAGAWRRAIRGRSVTTTFLDGFGRTSATTNSVGVSTDVGYDALGRKIYESLPYTSDNRGASYEYDALDRLRIRRDIAGNVTRFDYTGIDVQITDEENRVTRQNWAASGDDEEPRLVAFTDADGRVASYEYNVDNRLTLASGDVVGGTRRWTYNNRGWLEWEEHPESGRTTYTYDPVGNTERRTNAKGETIIYTYDRNNRKTFVDYPGLVYDTIIAYDHSDNRVTLATSAVQSTFEHDALNRLTLRHDRLGATNFTTTYRYESSGYLDLITYPSGAWLNYDTDSEGRITTVHQSGTPPFARDMTYHPSGALASLTMRNGVVETFTYDERHRPRRIASGTPGMPSGIVGLTHTYDRVNNVTLVDDERPGMDVTATYDNVDRVRTANGPWGSLGYTYNARGDREGRTGHRPGTYSYQFSTNHLLHVSGVDQETLGYDAAGNLTSDGRGTYTYAPTEMMDTAAVSGMFLSYVYDGDGLRKQRRDGTITTYFVHDHLGQLLAEYEENCGQVRLSKEYIYAGTRLLASKRPTLFYRPIVSIPATAQISEGGGAWTLPLTVHVTDGTGGLACPLIVPLAAEPGSASSSDFPAWSGIATFPAFFPSGGTLNVSISASAIDDALDEDTETFSVRILAVPGGAIGANGSTLVSILDNDPPPTVSIADGEVVEGNTGTATLIFPVTLGQVSGRVVTASYATVSGSATAGTDFTAATGSVVIPAGASGAVVSVAVLGDLIDEGHETLTAQLTGAVNAVIDRATAVGTIVNDDCYPVVTPQTLRLPTAAGSSTLQVSGISSGCTWTASSQSSWLTVQAGSSGQGAGTVTVARPQHYSRSARTGTLTVAGKRVLFTQASPAHTQHVLDTFSDLDNTDLSIHAPDLAAGAWTPPGRAYVAGGQAALHSGAGYQVAAIDADVADGTVAVDWIPGPGTEPFGGLVLRYVDANNHLLLRYWSGTFEAYRYQAGVFTRLGGVTMSDVAAGQPHRLAARLNGSTIEAFWDGVSQFTVTDSFQVSAEHHGIAWVSQDAGARYDHFEVTRELPPSTGLTLVPDIAAPQPAGTTVNWTATASGTGAPFSYKWWIFDGIVWTVAREWSGDATFTWRPVVPNASYSVAIWVRSAGNTADEGERYIGVPFPIDPPVVTADTVIPGTGTGSTQTFALQYSSTAGATDLSRTWVWFNPTLATVGELTCMAYYDRAANTINLLDDSGTQWESAALGTTGTLQSGRCGVALSGTAVSLAGNTLTWNLAVTFAPQFSGSKNIYMYAASSSGAASGWQHRGTWTVPVAAGALVTADSASPASGTGATQTFALRYSSSQGAADLSRAWVWFNPTFATSSANSCMAYYDRPANTLYLLNDAGTAWTPGSLGGSGTIGNSRCRIALNSSTAALSGNTLTLTLAMTFHPTHSGATNIYLHASNMGGTNSGWQHRGTWIVPGAEVTADAVSPGAGIGSAQTFALQYSSTAGATDLARTWVWFNATLAGVSELTCMAHYDRQANTVNLLDDSGTQWQSAGLGTSGTLQNSRCTIALGGTTVSLAGNTLTWQLAVTFAPQYSGSKNVYMFAASGTGAQSGWQQRGSWTVPAATGVVVTADAVSPASGTGATPTFARRYSSSQGAADLSRAWIWFNASFASSSANSCIAYYDRPANTLYLLNDAGTVWTPGSLGTSGTLENSRCRIALGSSTAVSSGSQ